MRKAIIVAIAFAVSYAFLAFMVSQAQKQDCPKIALPENISVVCSQHRWREVQIVMQCIDRNGNRFHVVRGGNTSL